MMLEISDDETIAEVQGLFHYFFPFLKIDFCEKDPLSISTGRPYRALHSGSRSLREFRYADAGASKLYVSRNMRVKELEEYFSNTYSLRAQVFRRSGNVWLETTVTGNWSLEEQNRQGESITAQMQHKTA